jgi:hypothetical protein
MEGRVGVNHLAQQSDRNLGVDRYRERTEHFTAGRPGRGGSDQYSGVGVATRGTPARQRRRCGCRLRWRGHGRTGRALTGEPVNGARVVPAVGGLLPDPAGHDRPVWLNGGVSGQLAGPARLASARRRRLTRGRDRHGSPS